MSNTTINIILLILSIVIGLIPLFVSLIKYRKKGFKDFIKDHYKVVLVSLLLIIGCIVRVCMLDTIPGGLNQDEASAGYDAYSIMTYGIDRNGMHYPVHLIAWGSGQNAAYSYLAIPFLKVFGNTTIGLRLPMALCGCVSLFVFYYVLRSFTSENNALIGLAFLSINPWHIMKSRWALESNLFPEMVFLAVLLLVAAIKNKNYIFFYISAVVFALSSYSYGTSYFFLFFFIIFFLIYLLIKKTFKWWHIVIYLAVVGILCMPIILFLYINIFDKETMHLLWFDIPKLKVDRFHAVTSVFSVNFFKDGINNLISGFNILFSQNDGLPWNYTTYYGTIYFLTLPFSVLGLLHGLFQNRKERFLSDLSEESKVMNAYVFLVRIWFVVSVMMMFIVSPNINRINIVWFPLILSGIIGLIDFIHLIPNQVGKNIARVALPLYYLASFVGFSIYYSTTWNNNYLAPSFYESFPEALAYAETLDAKTTYISNRANYTLVLYYTKYDTNKYLDTVKIINPGAAFESISSFEGYSFTLPSKLTKGNAYIVFNADETYSEKQIGDYPVTKFKYYSVIDTTNHE